MNQNRCYHIKTENAINGCCSKSTKSTKWAAKSTKCMQNVNPTLGSVKCAQKWQKLVQKHQKRVEHLHEHPPKHRERKWRLERKEKKKCAAGIWKRDLILVVPSPRATIFTKMSFCHSKLQKCQSWASNVGPLAKMTWKWRQRPYIPN